MRYLVFFVLIGYFILIEKKKVGGLKIEKRKKKRFFYIYEVKTNSKYNNKRIITK